MLSWKLELEEFDHVFLVSEQENRDALIGTGLDLIES